MKTENQIKNQNGPRDAVSREAEMAFVARDRLDDATIRSAALLEALAALVEFSEKSNHPQLSGSAVEGLQLIALQEGANLRDHVENYTQLLAKGRLVAA